MKEFAWNVAEKVFVKWMIVAIVFTGAHFTLLHEQSKAPKPHHMNIEVVCTYKHDRCIK